MESKRKQVSDLSKPVEAISKITEVVGIILFGSHARGDYDEYSDYDLLILFRDRRSMWRRWDSLFKITGELEMDLHLVPKALDELREGNPIFLKEVFEKGRVLYAKLPFEVSVTSPNLRRFSIIFYELKGLFYKDKMRILYYLYGKKGKGAVTKLGGVKLAEGCIAVPRDSADDVIENLKAYRANIRRLDTYLVEDELSSVAILRS